MTLWHHRDKIQLRAGPTEATVAEWSESPKTPALVGAVDEAAMNATREIVAASRWPEALRWGGCLGVGARHPCGRRSGTSGLGEVPDSSSQTRR